MAMASDSITTICSHCEKGIPTINIQLHEAHCSRNLQKCSICGEIVPIKHAEEHFKESHAPEILHGTVKMELQNTPFTIQVGRGVSIQLANAVINTGNSEATIRFGSLEFFAATAMAAAVPIHGMTVQGHSARPNSVEIYARRAYSVQQPQATRSATAIEVQQNRTSVFERLSHPEVSIVKRTDIKQKTLPILSSVITLPTEPFVPGRHDHEASSSGGRLSRRQRRKLNAELRARQPLPVHPSTLPALEPEANVPT
ncbi:hypothetical protein M5K25_017780 [Dendrobium thyrsiflorum]|uniref:C2H2-type domain-containing protein n=1 Tax=Dendrobium thyrsiflorum TaxID=117978 RepID=A0ABD0UGI2_DENTH